MLPDAPEPIRETLEPFADARLIPLPQLAERMRETVGIDFDMRDRNYAIRRGLVDVSPVLGYRGARQVSHSEAEKIVLAALVAVAAGATVAAVLGVIKPGMSAGLIKAATAAAIVTH